MGKNVLISRETLELLVLLLDCPEVERMSNFPDIREILRELKLKVQRIELRETYAKFINAGDDDSRFDARIEYLWQKSQLGKVDIW